jgi:hypothetical protein
MAGISRVKTEKGAEAPMQSDMNQIMDQKLAKAYFFLNCLRLRIILRFF